MVKKVTTLIVCVFLLLSGIYGCTDKKEFNLDDFKLEKKDEKYIIPKDGVIYCELEDDKFLFNTIDDSEKIKDGKDNVLFLYDLKSQKAEKYLETINKDYMFKQVYNVNNKWLVWIESAVKVDYILQTTGGKYIIGAKDLETGEVFKIKEMNGSVGLDPIVNIDPTDILFDKETIAYKSMIVSGTTYSEAVETFNLKTREPRIEHAINDFFKRRISNVSLKNGKIAYCEYPYDPQLDSKSEVYYYDLGSKKKVILKEDDKNMDMTDAFLTDRGIYLNKYLLGKEITETSIDFIDLENKKEKNIFKESEFGDIGTFPIVKYEIGDKLFLESTLGIKIYDTKKGEIVPIDSKLKYLEPLGDYAIVEYNNGEETERCLIKINKN
ncbi:hypothetical protein [Clostridium baratii]|uniref:hypothetical protein n=1 Tax=Clostridium baratii TaxID=1561 RepID=UPI0006C43279|nr:hypothetical protein [Clostridium baratii]MDU4910985.1 hypothetical protein [Clostridium baratii]CUP51434.1 Uncharacterised protein [Clostridium baratii]